MPSNPGEIVTPVAGVVVEGWAELDQPEHPPGTLRKKPTRRRCGHCEDTEPHGKIVTSP
jgi:hypothetical protein